MTAVIAGSFGSHGLRNKVEQRDLEVWEIAAKYQFYHSLAMLVAVTRLGAGAKVPCILFASGTAIFSGSLYALVLTGNRKLGAITPIGGMTLIAGWLSLMFV